MTDGFTSADHGSWRVAVPHGADAYLPQGPSVVAPMPPVGRLDAGWHGWAALDGERHVVVAVAPAGLTLDAAWLRLADEGMLSSEMPLIAAISGHVPAIVASATRDVPTTFAEADRRAAAWFGPGATGHWGIEGIRRATRPDHPYAVRASGGWRVGYLERGQLQDEFFAREDDAVASFLPMLPVADIPMRWPIRRAWR